VSLKKLFFF